MSQRISRYLATCSDCGSGGLYVCCPLAAKPFELLSRIQIRIQSLQIVAAPWLVLVEGILKAT